MAAHGPPFRSQILEEKKSTTIFTHLSQAVKAVPPCNLVSQLFSIGMAWKKDDFKKEHEPSAGLNHNVFTEWQWPLSCVDSITVEKSAQRGEGGV